MGKFAFHFSTFTAERRSSIFNGLEYTFVNFSGLSAKAKSTLSNNRAPEFRDAWQAELAKITDNFDNHWKKTNGIVLDAVLSGGGGHDAAVTTLQDLGMAIEIYSEIKGAEATLNFLQDAKVLLKVASLNAEALLRALRKFDKRATLATGGGAPAATMMQEFLPELYSASFFQAISAISINDNIERLRTLVEGDEAKAAGEAAFSVATTTAEARKGDEYSWFHENARTLNEKELGGLVSHRGFHDEEDDSVSRPIENSLQAFEYAWGAGVHLCECDVGATKDEKIIMAHDETFNRLALLSGKANANTHVKDLTLQEIMRTPLKHGARPPLLVDVLRSAMAIGDHAKLVIEIKPGNSEIVDPLMQLFQRHPALLSRVAVIMSFDAYVIREISESLEDYRMQRQSGQFGRGLETINEGGSGTSLRRGSFSRASLFSRKKAVQSVSYGLSYTEDIHDNLPNLLVLTKAFPKDKKIVISVKDGFDGYDRKLPDGIDGVYLEYEPEMLEPEGQKELLKLAESVIVGVWMLKPRDPDALSVARKLMDDCGVSYVNTDFHRDFFST